MYENLEIIGKGGEGIVYKYNGKALKVLYKTNPKRETVSKILSKLKLNQIITPDEIIYDENGLYKGYTMKYLNKSLSPKLAKKEMIIESIKIIKEDLIRLSENKILASDLIPTNSLLSENKIYFIDTGCYELSDCPLETSIKINNQQLEYYLYRLLQQSTGSLQGSKIIKNIVYCPYTVIEEKMSNEETLEEFAKRLVK